MENNQTKKASRNFRKLAFFILLAWVCAVAFTASYRRPVHASTDVSTLTDKLFYLRYLVGWKLNSTQANAALASMSLQPNEQILHTASTVPAAVHLLEK